MGKEQRTEQRAERPAPRRRPPAGHLSPADRLRKASEQFGGLTGVEIECVSGTEKSEDGRTLTLETMELRRIPDTVIRQRLAELAEKADSGEISEEEFDRAEDELLCRLSEPGQPHDNE